MKKAFAWLEGNGIEYTLHDYKKRGVPEAKVKAWIRQAGRDRVLNTQSKTFRDLPAERRQNLNDATSASLMCEFPSVMKRPVLESGAMLLIGFDADEYTMLATLRG